MADPTSAELKYLVSRQREEIKTINEVGRLLRSTTDPGEIIRLVATYLRQAFPVALCGILLIESRKLHLIRFAPISKVDMTAAIRELLKATQEQVHQMLREEEIACVVEDQFSATSPWAGVTVGSLRSQVSVPLTFNAQAVGLLGVFSGQAGALTQQEDIHAIQIVAEQLRGALRNALLVERLRSADQMKNDLLAMISHELKIPLTVIREGVSLLKEGALGPTNTEQQDFLKTVSDNVDRLNQLLDKVLTATHVITGKIQARLAQVNVGALLKEWVSTFGPLATSRGVRLESNGAEPTPWTVDREKLQQALGHVMENAIQASSSGGRVVVSWVVEANQLQIQVTDTGSGISPQELGRLFERFGAIGGIHERKTGGLGLGLFITKALVDIHQGIIRVESTPGEGTRVTIRLPQKT